MSKAKAPFEAPSTSLVPSLRSVVAGSGLDPTKLGIALQAGDKARIHLTDRNCVKVSDGERFAEWTIASVSELFRGERLPPADLQQYPPEYVPYFFFIEKQLLLLCDLLGDRTDQEMEEIYAALRRRPDGRSLGTSHDFMWQVSALLLGQYILSRAEFEGLMDGLLRSARRWGQRPVSRFYLAYLRNELGSPS